MIDKEKAIRAALLTAKGVKVRPAGGDTAAENIADYVAELLREGRASEITDDLIAQADPQRLHQHYASGNTGMDMPMDYASRMERAAQMGFGPDVKMHGTPHLDIDRLRPSEFGAIGPGVYLTRRPATASDYASGYGQMDPQGAFEQDRKWHTVGGNIMPVMTKGDLQPFADWTGAKMDDLRAQGPDGSWYKADMAATAAAKDAGFAGVQGRNENSTIFDPTNIRSQFARFDPRLSHLSHLSAATGGAIKREDGGEVTDLGAARDQRQLQGFHKNMMGGLSDLAAQRMEAHQKALDAGVFDGYEVGDTLKGDNAPMKITGRFVRPWKPTPMVLAHFERMGAKPTIIEHEGKQYIPMLRTMTGVKDSADWQEGDAYLDMVKALGYPKMGGLRTVKADGGSVTERSPMFEGTSEHLMDDDGKHMELWHGTPGEPFRAFDDSKIGNRDAGFFGEGHYLTPERGNAEGYADPDEMGRGAVMGPLHAALKNPYLWDTSSDDAAHRTLRDLQSMGIMRGQGKLEPWDIIQRHDMDTFMRHMQQRGHDGVIVRTRDHTGDRPHRVTEVVVFKPSMIKHRDAEIGDPNDPDIMRGDGGKVDLHSKAARIVRGLKDRPMPVEDIVRYARGKGAKQAEIEHANIPAGKMLPSQLAEHFEDAQPQIGVVEKGRQEGLEPPIYEQYQLPGGDNYREHILTLDSQPEDQTFKFRGHWGDLSNPLAHIRMSDRHHMYPSQPMVDLLNEARASSQAWDVPTQLEHGVSEGILSPEMAATIASRLDLKSSKFYGKPDLDKKFLHIEEMQSDWNNVARNRGFRTGREQQDYDDFVADMRRLAISRLKSANPSVEPPKEQVEKYQSMDPYTLAQKLGLGPRHRELARAAHPNTMAAPTAPYIDPKREDWAELAMKHVLMEAAKGGYNGIIFTPDSAQSQRWGGTNFDGIYDKKLPGIAQRLVQQHDPSVQPDQVGLPATTTPSAMIPLTDTARQGILQNGFSSFMRGGYVTHVRRAR